MELSIIELVVIKLRRDDLLNVIQEQLWQIDAKAVPMSKTEAQDFAYMLGRKLREVQIYNRLIDKNTKHHAVGVANG